MNFEYWSKLEYWYLAEAVFILLGYKPPPKNEWERILYPSMDRKRNKKYEKLQQLFEVANRVSWSSLNGDIIFHNRMHTELPPKVFLKWAKKMGYTIPDELNLLITDDTKSKNEIEQPKERDTFGQKAANKRWEPHNALMDMAILLAEEKWKSGDKSYHNEMATKIVGLKEFKPLEDSKKALRKRLKPIARKHNLVRGDEGAVRPK